MNITLEEEKMQFRHTQSSSFGNFAGRINIVIGGEHRVPRTQLHTAAVPHAKVFVTQPLPLTNMAHKIPKLKEKYANRPELELEKSTADVLSKIEGTAAGLKNQIETIAKLRSMLSIYKPEAKREMKGKKDKSLGAIRRPYRKNWTASSNRFGIYKKINGAIAVTRTDDLYKTLNFK